jgi:hypothetical protein
MNCCAILQLNRHRLIREFHQKSALLVNCLWIESKFHGSNCTDDFNGHSWLEYSLPAGRVGGMSDDLPDELHVELMLSVKVGQMVIDLA